MHLRLISFPICPFVQRARIALHEKKKDYAIDFIDLSDKPQWFLKISPRGKVPVVVADDVPLFESQAICEFLEETIPVPALLPQDPVLRARDRAWFTMASEDLFGPAYRYEISSDEAAVQEVLGKLESKLDRLDGELQGRDFLSGDGTQFGMADVGMAPFFVRSHRWAEKGWTDVFRGRSALGAYCDRLVSRDSVQRSLPDDFDVQMTAYQSERTAWVLQ